jgi:GTP-binding protein Era
MTLASGWASAAKSSMRAAMSDTPAPTPALPPATTRAGFVALIGEPNAGKSTLLNRMVGAKVSIVTHKVQTTRARIRGIAMAGAAQIVFVDTPGLFRPRRRLDRAMVKAAWGGAADADIVVLLVEAHRGLTEGAKAIIDRLASELPKDRPVALAINKIDRVKAEVLLGLSAELNAAHPFAATFMISAERGYGVDTLRDWLGAHLPEGPWLYPEDQIADLPLRMIAAETTREKLTLRLHEELPYQLTVETEAWTEREDGSVRIDQVIYVSREGHKGIVLGHKGETVKIIGQQARAEIAAFLERPVHLFLTVKLRENWQEEAERYSEMGLEFRDGD